MKKLLGVMIGIALVAVPASSFAKTTDAGTAYRAALQQLINLLTQQLLSLEAQLAKIQSQNNISLQATISASSIPDAWSAFPKTMFNSFADAPTSYLGQQIEIKGEVGDFLPLGGNGGTHNYIEVADPNAYTNKPVMLKIDNNANYLATVNKVQKNDLVAAYGTSVGTTRFSMNGQNTNISVLDITRLDDVGGCDIYGCLVSSDTVIFPAGAVPLTTPQNSMSSSLSN